LHVFSRLLATGTVGLILFAAPAASAQVDGSLTDPVESLESAPSVDGCTADPASCLPEAPPVDGCVADPSSCVPLVPDPDPCVQDPASCVSVGGLSTGVGTRDRLSSDREEAGRQQDQPAPGAPVLGGVSDERAPRGSQPADRGPGRPDRPAPPASPISLVTAPRPQQDRDAAVDGLGGFAQAVRDFAFPIVLLVGVSLFLAIQSRIDRKDPKLTMAPVSSRHDVVEFV
jgi:hypothetical protein